MLLIMSKGKSDKIKYKPYYQDQAYLFPPTDADLIPQNHLVRLVSQAIDELGIEKLMRKYQVGGGTSRYNPVMLTKLFVYGYMTKVCSSRMLAKAVRENIMYMWLAGGQKPDFRTLNRFRGLLLKGVMEEIFVSAVKILQVKGHVKLEQYFVDGTKIESASGKYTFTWKKNVDRHNKQLDERVRAYLEMVNDIWKHENEAYGDEDIEDLICKEEITSEDIKELVTEIKERISQLEESEGEGSKKKVKMQLERCQQKMEKVFLPKKNEYEKSKEILGERNSYSKTDIDATCMRMKEGSALHPLLRPGYNIQIGTENGFIVGYDIFPNPTDTRTFKPHLQRQEERFGVNPKVVIADAGYGSEENYKYLEDKNIVGIVKYGMFHTEQSKKWKENIWKTDNWAYNEKEKYYQCPNGRRLNYKETEQKKNSSGYQITFDVYECESCKYCRMKKECTKSKFNRKIERNKNWLRLKNKFQTIFEDEENRKLYKRRSVEVETVFGQLKGNQGNRRFLTRGKENVYTEWGLLSLGYNLRQLYRVSKQKAV